MPFTRAAPPSFSSPNVRLETDSPFFLPDCLALAGPIKSPQDLCSNEPPGSSRPFSADQGQLLTPLPCPALPSASLLHLFDVCFLSITFWPVAAHDSTF